MSPGTFTVEVVGSSDHGPCECCGNRSRTVWGYLWAGGCAAAAYYVQWTLTRVHDHGANFDLVVGDWDEDSSPADRQIVAVAYRLFNGSPQFMVIDAESRPVAEDGGLASTSLRHDQVIGTPLAGEVFAMLDAIWLGDPCIAELKGNGGGQS